MHQFWGVRWYFSAKLHGVTSVMIVISIVIAMRISDRLSSSTGVLINPQPDQEGKHLMVLSEWREFPSAPCLAGKKLDDGSRLHVVEIARP